MEIKTVKIESLKQGRNPRYDYGDMDGLRASICERGIEEPLRIKPDGEIIDGHRRYRAILEINAGPGKHITEVPAIVDDEDSSWTQEMRMLTSIQKEKLNMTHRAPSQSSSIRLAATSLQPT
jgi:ParB-like chromosome segregation protein Spo0J